MNSDRQLTKKELLERLKEEGFTHTYVNFIRKYEKSGQLKLRRDPFRGIRVMSEAELEDLISTLKEQGKDFVWHAKEAQ